MDFRRFLHESNEIVAPVVGRNVWLGDRRLGFDHDDGEWLNTFRKCA